MTPCALDLMPLAGWCGLPTVPGLDVAWSLPNDTTSKVGSERLCFRPHPECETRDRTVDMLLVEKSRSINAVPVEPDAHLGHVARQIRWVQRNLDVHHRRPPLPQYAQTVRLHAIGRGASERT